MTTTIDKKKYLELLDSADIIPKTIETEEEYDRFLAVAQMLMHKRSDRTSEDIALLMLVVKLIEDYESIHHNLDDWEKSTPNDLLRHRRYANDLAPTSGCALLLGETLRERSGFPGIRD
jgi:HTH-type transcriptional regulator / antitoxin HigA